MTYKKITQFFANLIYAKRTNKSSSLIRFFMAVICVILNPCASWSQALNCGKPKFTDDTFLHKANLEINVNGNIIYVLGRRHPRGNMKDITESYLKVRESFRQNDCNGVANAISRVFRNRRNDLDLNQANLNDLKRVVEKYKFRIIGSESSPEENERLENLIPQADMDTLIEGCPGAKKTLKDLYLVSPGPEFFYAFEHRNITIKPLEKWSLKKPALEIQNDDTEDFDLSTLSDAALARYNEFYEYHYYHPNAPDDDKWNAINEERDPVKKEKLKLLLPRLAVTLKYSALRDKYITSQAIQLSKSIGILVGYGHAKRLKAAFDLACKNGLGSIELGEEDELKQGQEQWEE
ncbi:MAG: hypothetical protein C5B49_04555 [Bdellovibrio sp.]|nr:MAG: hypothetical protein C5B49_04555 [Bdellovibrio sp.]